MAENVPQYKEFVTIHDCSVSIINMDEEIVLGVGQGISLNDQYEQFLVKGWGSHVGLGVAQGVASASGNINYFAVAEQEFYEGIPSVAGCWPTKLGVDGWTLVVKTSKCSPMGEGKIIRVMRRLYLTSNNLNLQPGGPGTYQMGFIALESYNPKDWARIAGN